jgi:hypothetical protein
MISKFHDLRFRPFLVIEAYVQPASHMRTERKGWKDAKDSQIVSEIPSVVDRVNAKIMRRAEVIIDIVNDRVIKNRLQGDSTIDPVTFTAEILTFYKDKYSKIVKQGNAVWVAQQAVAMAKTALNEAK